MGGTGLGCKRGHVKIKLVKHVTCQMRQAFASVVQQMVFACQEERNLQ